MAGGTGDDIYIVDVAGDTVIELTGEGTDTVRTTLNAYMLGANVENLVFTGSGNFTGTGNELANAITGGSGADTMAGGAGDDSYVVDNSGDVVIEAPDGGNDTIITSLATFKLAADLENLTYTGAKGFTGTGNAAANVITGAAGTDRLDGLGGADTMAGGLGNDTYVVDNVGDQVIEKPGEGSDRIISQVSFSASENVEILQLSTSKAINATGNALANTLIGNGGANVLDGRGGADVLTGGRGVDTFQFQRGEAQGDVVKDFAGAGVSGGDILRFVGFGADASITQVGSSDLFAIHAGAAFGGATEVIELVGVTHIAAGDYIFV